MKKFTKVISLIIAIVLLFCLCTFSASAATCVSEGTENKTFAVNDTITITFRYDAGQPIYTAEGTVSFDPEKLKFSTANVRYSTTSSSVSFLDDELSTDTKQVSKGTYQFKFIALAEGSTNVSISLFGNNIDLQRLEASSTANVTIKNPTTSTPSTPSTPSNNTPSSNASLSSLKVSGATLSPSFKATTTKYTAKVSNTTEKVSISGNAVDGGVCEGLGTFNLNVGDNVRYITVTAADGKTKKTYSVNIIRAAEGEDVPEENAQPLSVLINEAAHTIVQQAPETAPAGFEISTATYNEQEVSVLKSADGKIVLYTIANDETQETNYYTYDEATNQFSLLKYAVLNGKMFIFAENEELGSAEGYEKTELTIGNATIEAYKSTDPKLSDFYVFYCFVEGAYGYYSYDSLEGTVQRAPTFKLVEVTEETEEKEVISSFKDLVKLDARGKSVIIVLLVIVLCVIALIVLVIIRFVKLRKLEEEDYPFFDENNSIFDEVNVDDNSGNNDTTI